MKRIVIFGAASFIGKNLVKELYKEYELILVMSNKIFFKDVFTTIDSDKIYIIEEMFKPTTDFESIINEGDIVIHLASSTNPTTSNQNISDEIMYNVLTSAKLFDKCVKKKVSKLIFISSGGTIYGKNARCPIPEDAQTDPINSYGLQKLSIEKMLYVYNQTYGLNYEIVRLSNPYGPYQRPNAQLGVITTFLYNSIIGMDINVYGDGSVIRDFIFIDDAVRAIKIIMENECRHRIYNIGSGKGVSINDILEIINREMHKKIKINYGKSRKVDVPKNYLNIDRFKKEYGDIPFVGLEEGIHLTRQFLESGVYEVKLKYD